MATVAGDGRTTGVTRRVAVLAWTGRVCTAIGRSLTVVGVIECVCAAVRAGAVRIAGGVGRSAAAGASTFAICAIGDGESTAGGLRGSVSRRGSRSVSVATPITDPTTKLSRLMFPHFDTSPPVTAMTSSQLHRQADRIPEALVG
jgi:hypothetical protein